MARTPSTLRYKVRMPFIAKGKKYFSPQNQSFAKLRFARICQTTRRIRRCETLLAEQARVSRGRETAGWIRPKERCHTASIKRARISIGGCLGGLGRLVYITTNRHCSLLSIFGHLCPPITNAAVQAIWGNQLNRRTLGADIDLAQALGLTPTDSSAGPASLAICEWLKSDCTRTK